MKNRLAREVAHAQRVLKAGMSAPVKDVRHGAKLPDVSHALEQGVEDDLHMHATKEKRVPLEEALAEATPFASSHSSPETSASP